MLKGHDRVLSKMPTMLVKVLIVTKMQMTVVVLHDDVPDDHVADGNGDDKGLRVLARRPHFLLLLSSSSHSP